MKGYCAFMTKYANCNVKICAKTVYVNTLLLCDKDFEITLECKLKILWI